MDIAICNIYPPTYWNLQGVTDITAPPELWWSSRERKPLEDGIPTSEYLELDFGRIRSFNFLNFNVIQKPIDITIEYDVWGFDSGFKYWVPVTRLGQERFDDRVEYSPNSANPWKNCQYYITNSKGDMISSRYLRFKFDRRNEPWPNGDVAGTFPWSIDVKDMRASRYVLNLNDARGIMVDQGKVVSKIVDPHRYVDGDTVTMIYEDPDSLDAGTAHVTGVVSGVEDYHQAVPLATDHESYLGFWASTDDEGIIAGGRGVGGMAMSINGNSQWSHTTGATIGNIMDCNEAGHLGSDLPGFAAGYAFFQGYPTPAYAWVFGIKNNGANTATQDEYNRNVGVSSGVGFGTNFSPPVAGDLHAYFIAVSGSETIDDDSLLLADGFVLADQSVTDPTTGWTGYLYIREATGTEGGSWSVGGVTLTGSVGWGASMQVIKTPSSYDGYLLDSGEMTPDPTPDGLEHGPIFICAQHGGFI